MSAVTNAPPPLPPEVDAPPPRAPRRRARRLLTGAAKAAGVLITFSGALVGGLSLHLDTPAARRLVVARVNPFLAATFRGKLEVLGVEHLDLHGAQGVSARLVDADGVTLISAQGLRARVSVVDVLRSVLLEKGDIRVSIPSVELERGEVSLDTLADGRTRIEAAFELRKPSDGTPGRGARVELSSIDLKHAWVHGRLWTLPPLDADVDALHGSLLVTPTETRVDVARLALAARGMPRGANPVGAAAGQVVVAMGDGHRLEIVASFRGGVGGVPAAGRFALDGAHLEAVVDVPVVAAAQVRTIFPEATIHDDVSAHVDVHGDLPHLDASMRGTLGAASLTAVGDVTVTATPFGWIRLAVDGVDARAFAADAPRSSLGTTARLTYAVQHDGAIAGDFDADLARGSIGATAVPRAVLRGDYHVQTAGAPIVTVHGRGRIEEQGAPADVVFSYTPEGRSQVLAVDAHASIARIGATRLGGSGTGRAKVHAVGRLRMPERALDAHLDADLEDAAEGPVRLARAHAEARVTGPLDAPTLSAVVDATGLGVGPLDFAQGKLTAAGAASGMNVAVSLRGAPGAPELDAGGLLDPRAGVRIRDVHATAKRDGVVAEVSVDELRAAGGELSVEGGVVLGLGAPLRVSARQGPSSVDARVATQGLDLARAGRLLGVADRVRGGTLAVDADLSATDRTVKGALTFDLVHASGVGSKDANAHVEATFAGRQVALRVHASEGSVGVVDVRRATLEIAGNERLDISSWKKVWGDAEIDASLDLATLLALAPVPAAVPLGDVTGKMSVRAAFSRAAGDSAPPSLRVALDTAGLTVGSATLSRTADGTVVVEQQGRRLEGYDVQLDASLDGPSGLLAMDARLADRKKLLLAVDAKASEVPIGEILAADDLAVALMGVPFSVRAVLPRRSLAALPLVSIPGTGDVAAMVEVRGTVVEPVVDATANLYGGKSAQAPITSKLDAELVLHYAAGTTDAALRARTPKAEVLTATARLKALVTDFVGASAKEDPPWEASATAKLSRFPLAAVAALSDSQVRGRASGELAIDGLHRDARAKGQFRIEGLEVGSASFVTALFDAGVADGAFHGAARLERAGAFGEAQADLGVAWGAALVPRIDPTKAALVTVRAKSFPVGAFSPLVEPALTDLEGKLDADARFAVPAGGRGGQASGSATLREGKLQVTALGQEYHGVEGKLDLSGDGVLRLDHLRARGTTGLVMAAGVARMDGLRLDSARASVRIPKSAPIPIGVQGVQMGDVYGDMELAAAASADGTQTDINVEVPVLHVRLPPSPPHTVQPLGEPEKVRIGTFRAPGQFVTLAIDGEDLREDGPAPVIRRRVNVAFHLGRDVTVERGKSLRVSLDGNPQVHVSDKTRMSGQIFLTSGTLEVQGKPFEIEKGTVSFVGDDPSNPEVVVTAGWTARDGTRVLADFVGPLKTGRVTLRSEPGRPQDEILALILFGTVDGSSSTPYAQAAPDGATRAGTAAGGLATEGLSRGIDSLTGLDIATKVDTTDSANPRPEVEIRIARDISLQVAFVLGTPPPGANPDHTFATLDWRFLRNWSLATTFGDQGSSIADVVWRHRY